ncbi:MAG: cyclic pyranopterin monophosphate synthase MoaC, partial [Thermotogota bacterium]|nr:cyclic pyranopterin monophosphate synthase MoaC [Thermotogota bacterium]
MKEFTHIDKKGRAKMVDVTDKDETKREAIAYGQIKLKESTLERIKNGQIEKGAVLETARVAGIMGVKKTSELIPMCHPLLITGIDIKFEFENATTLGIYATVRTTGKTGVETPVNASISTP